MITVVNKHKNKPNKDDVYCGRGSPYGNPYSWLPGTPEKFKVKDRDEAIKKYEEYFKNSMISSDHFIHSMQNLVLKALHNENLNLVCYCAPKSCHCDVIKKYIDGKINDIHNIA